MDRQKLLQLTLNLCNIDSTTGKEAAAIDYLDSFLSEKGWQTKRQFVGPTNGRETYGFFR